MKVILTTPRLLLRAFEEGDEELLFNLNHDIEVVKYTGNPPMEDITEAKRVLHELIIPQYAAGFGRWAVHLKLNKQFIGWCGLKQTENGVDIGYRFLKKFWRNGYGSESAHAVLKYAFERRHIDKIVAHAVVDNIHSLKILDKLGLNRTEVVDEGYRTIQKFELTKEGYQHLQLQNNMV
jgi:[ribosomal protein S5]-alanine N-acetyltransferase